MRTRDQEEFQRKKIMLMEKCYDCYAENGLASVGIRKLAESCGCSSAVLYIYFRDLDDLIVQSTAYCMKKVEDDFMAKAPTDPQDLMRFIDEIPYWTARQHGKKYRLMYQVYTHPKYIRYGKQFFEGVNRRYTEYAKSLEPKLGIPYTLTAEDTQITATFVVGRLRLEKAVPFGQPAAGFLPTEEELVSALRPVVGWTPSPDLPLFQDTTFEPIYQDTEEPGLLRWRWSR